MRGNMSSNTSDASPDNMDLTTGSGENNPIADAIEEVHPNTAVDTSVAKRKRLACTLCRKRKLRCDSVKPSCGTCKRLNHTCTYSEVRKKSGPKRGYVKALEERLNQVESLLKAAEPLNAKTNNAPDTDKVTKNTTDNIHRSPPQPTTASETTIVTATADLHITNPPVTIANGGDVGHHRFNNGGSPQAPLMDDFSFNDGGINLDFSADTANSFTWEMIGLGLDEPLPPQSTIDELHQIYFDKVHPSVPMIHKFRYLATMNLAPDQRPPVALRYATWAMACSTCDRFFNMKELFYDRARKYLEADRNKGFGEKATSVAHIQVYILLTLFEFKAMYFPRAWMNAGSATRLCHMTGLNAIDDNGQDLKQCLPPPRDWTEKEERRRTFWMAFSNDRFSSIGTGWPMSMDERDIRTHLPASEDAFEMGKAEATFPLADSLCSSGAAKLSSFGGVILMACLFGRNIRHLSSSSKDEPDHSLHGGFWKSHRALDNLLLNTSLCLPEHLKLPFGMSNPNIVFTNMTLHTCTICLHQAAIVKADAKSMPASVGSESKVRCITAANEISSIMRTVSHLDLAKMHTFTSFCLYVASRVFIQFLKSRPDDVQTMDALRFLLTAMSALKRKQPMTESFLVQLDVDLEGLMVQQPKLRGAFPSSSDDNLPLHPVILVTMREARVAVQGGVVDQGKINCGTSPLDIGLCNFSDENTDKSTVSTNKPDMVKILHNGGNQATRPNESQQVSMVTDAEPGVSHQQWLPTRTAPTESFMNYQVNSDHDISGSSHPDSGSNRPTPNSSTMSDYRQSSVSGPSDHTSFDASPIGSNQPLGTQAEMDAANAAFFSDSGGYGLSNSTGSSTNQPFGVSEASDNPSLAPGGWGIPGQAQQSLSSMSEGVVKQLMELDAFESMDFVGWGDGQPS